MFSRKLAVAGSIATLSLVGAPFAAAATGTHDGSSSSRDRVQHVDRSRDGKQSRDGKRTLEKRNSFDRRHRDR